MNDMSNSFQERLERIKDANEYRRPTPYVTRPDGLKVPREQPRLRFTFPLKGLIFAFCVAVGVKAYLIWALGADVYEAAVARLLNGTGLERVAGQILAPDGVSLWLVVRFEWIAVYSGELLSSLTA